MKPLVYAPLLASALLLGWYLLPERETPEPRQAAVATPPPASPPTALPAMLTNQRPEQPPLEASQRGTQVDGQLQVDANGNLIVTDQLRHLFDYFLSAVGEISHAQALQRIRQYLQANLRAPALQQAEQLLDSYVEYLQALIELEERFPVVADLDGLHARELAVQRLRASLFDAEAHAAFFAKEELYNGFTLERLAIQHDSQLSAAEKAEQIEALREGLPEELQALLVPQLHSELRQQTSQLQAQGASAEEIRELRMNMVGPEATARLEALDQQRNQWQQRFQRFSEQRQQILRQSGLAESDRLAEVEQLLHSQFNDSERLRVLSLLELQGD